MKNKILYLTTSIHKDLLKDYIKNNFPLNNPSNQNFHNRFIKLLSKDYELEVISYRSNLNKDELSQHNYHYPKVGTKLFDKLFLNEKKIYNISTKFINETDYIFVDALNLKLLKVAIKLNKIWGKKVIAIITDNPANITSIKKTFIIKWNTLIKQCNAYIVLTETLRKLIPSDKKSIILGALLPDFNEIKPHENSLPYIYFAGALYRKYGVNNLIEAYLNSPIKNNYELVIAGHGELSNLIKENKEITFLSQIDEDTNLSYVLGASLLINPRPYNDVLDKESIPSKMIEYIVSKRPICSTHHSLLKGIIEDNIIWVKDDLNGLLEGFNAFLSANHEDLTQKSNIAKKKIESYFSNENTLNTISDLLKNLI